MGKNEKVKNISGLQNGAIRRLQIGAGFKDYRSGQEGFQIGTQRLLIGAWISNRGKEISNRGKRDSIWGRDYKSVQNKANSYQEKPYDIFLCSFHWNCCSAYCLFTITCYIFCIMLSNELFI